MAGMHAKLMDFRIVCRHRLGFRVGGFRHSKTASGFLMLHVYLTSASQAPGQTTNCPGARLLLGGSRDFWAALVTVGNHSYKSNNKTMMATIITVMAIDIDYP